MAKSGTRLTVFICNVIISIVCAISVLAYFVSPLWRVKISYNMSAEMLESLMQENGEDSGEGGESEIVSDKKQLETIKEVVGDGITLKLTIEIKTQDVLASLNKPATETVQNLLNANIDRIMDQLEAPLNQIAENLARSTAKQGLKEAVREQVKNILGESATEEEITEKLNNAGFSEEYIEAEAEKILDALYAENATTQSVSQKVEETVLEVFDKLAHSGEESFEDLTLTEENKAQIHDAIEETISVFADEEGNIDMENFMAELILQALEKSEKPEDDGESASRGTTALSAATDETNGASDEEVKDAQEELKEKIRTAIAEKLPESAASMIAQVMKIISYVLIFTFFTWAYIVLKILLKLFAKNNTVKLKLPIWLGHIPFTVFCFIPTVAFNLLSAPAKIMGLGSETIAKITEFMTALDISFYSSGWFSFAAGIFFILFSLIFYSRQRKKLKRAIKEEKRRRKEGDYEYSEEIDEYLYRE
ncbi:MAG: hypothetical protein IJY62_06780 [Clostridia bacterium]|nr:hypothetical protein [Clostridia bacterium]